MAKDRKETVRKLKEAFAIGADVTAACAFAEISRETYYDWCKKDPKLAEETDRLREKPVLKAFNTVYKELDKVDTAKWYLERRRKTDFSTRQELTGAEGADLFNEEASTKSNELIDELLDEGEQETTEENTKQ